MTTLVFWNRGTGKSENIVELRTAMQALPTTWIELTQDVNLQREIEISLENGGDTVIAAGGDGTVNVVVNALMKVEEGRRPSLAIIPLGTANDFAGTLRIPDNVEQAVELFVTTSPKRIDLVRTSGEGFEYYFANVAAGGNCVRVSEGLTDELKRIWGPLSYIRGSISVLADMKSYRITANIDGEEFDGLDCWAILVANGRSNAGRIEVAPNASPSDGMLDVVMIKDGGVLDMIEIVTGNLTGNFLECDQVIFRQAKQLRLQSVPPMRFTLDGEVIEKVPAEFNVVPGAIRMFVGK